MSTQRRRPRMTMDFPSSYATHRYNRIHFSFFLQMAHMAGVSVSMVPDDAECFVPTEQLIWSCRVNGQQVIFDYSDHYYRDWKSEFGDVPYFKFQATQHSNPGVIPLGPPMVGGKRRGVRIADLESYYTLRRQWQYIPQGLVTCKQLPNGAAVERRNLVQGMLRENFTDVDVSSDTDQLEFWQLHQKCSVSVCVPGANNNMIDRGHMELLGLGVCTVSPAMHTRLCQDRLLVPGQHYIQCRDDYSDLVDIIRDILTDAAKSYRIGVQARKFFDKVYTPRAYWQWILANIRSQHD